MQKVIRPNSLLQSNKEGKKIKHFCVLYLLSRYFNDITFFFKGRNLRHAVFLQLHSTLRPKPIQYFLILLALLLLLLSWFILLIGKSFWLKQQQTDDRRSNNCSINNKIQKYADGLTTTTSS